MKQAVKIDIHLLGLNNLKTTKKIISFFNLFLFIGMFCFAPFAAFSKTQGAQICNNNVKQFVAKHQVESTDCNQSLIEKNENETEHECSMQVFSYELPFLLSHFQINHTKPTFSSISSLAASKLKPIYLSVGNFRI